MQKAIDFRKANTENLIIGTDNNPQFKAKSTDAIMKGLNITHEFDYKNNPNSKAYIESFRVSVQRGFLCTSPIFRGHTVI
jgi:transposase InsO family protein